MPRQEPDNNHIDLLQGTLDMLILRTLQWGPQPRPRDLPGHPGQLGRPAEGGNRLALSRASPPGAAGWLASDWKVSEKNQRAKYYRLTAAGKKQLLAEESKWGLLVKAITGVMKSRLTPGGGE